MTSSPEDPVESRVLRSTDAHVRRLTLNRPDALNAITPDLREDLIRGFLDASADPDVRAVVLTGRGRGFCAGADLRGAVAGGERIPGDVAPHPPPGRPAPDRRGPRLREAGDRRR
ncbi:enoyl-CoA hydratase/isomerase-like protein [Streptomyces sp. 3212.3]|nr:enoyl-CoA hydratase/isomerase-like protein [Streptomyces sp. 3212.3]